MTAITKSSKFVQMKPKSNGGINLSLPAEDIDDGEVVEALNMNIIGRSRAVTRFGYDELGSSTGIGAGKIQGLLTYYKTTGTKKDHLLVFTEGDDGAANNIFSYRTDNKVWSTGPIGSIGTKGERVRGAILNDLAVFGNGVLANTMKKFDGTNLTNVTTAPPDGNVFTVLNSSMYCLDPNQPSKVYRSVFENPDDWGGATATQINIELSDGTECKGLFANQDRINVLKEKTKHVITLLFDSTAAIVASQVKPFRDRSGGCIMPDSVQEIYSDIFTLAELDRGIQRFGEFQQFQGGSPRSTNVSIRVNSIIAQFNRSKVEDGAAKFFGNKYYLAAPLGIAQANNYVIVYNWEFDNFTTYDHFPASCFEIFRDENKQDNLVFGSASQPKLYALNKAYSDNGLGYTRRLKTKKYNDGDPWRMKFFRFFDIKGAIAFSTNLKITVYIDSVEAFTRTITKDSEEVTFTTAPSNSGLVGFDTYGNEFVGGSVSSGETTPLFPFTARIDIPLENRRGRDIQVSFESDKVGHGWYLNFPYIRPVYDALPIELEQ